MAAYMALSLEGRLPDIATLELDSRRDEQRNPAPIDPIPSGAIRPRAASPSSLIAQNDRRIAPRLPRASMSRRCRAGRDRADYCLDFRNDEIGRGLLDHVADARQHDQF